MSTRGTVWYMGNRFAHFHFYDETRDHEAKWRPENALAHIYLDWRFLGMEGNFHIPKPIAIFLFSRKP